MGVFSFVSKVKHILQMLLRIEFIVLIVFLIFVITLPKESLFIRIYFLIFVVCEGALGLTLLVSISRSYGGDNSYLLSLRY